MIVFRRPYVWGTAMLVVLLILTFATPAFSYTREHSWALIQAFKETMNYRVSRYERYFIPLLALVLVFLGLGAYWLRSQMIKRNSQPWNIHTDFVNSGNKSQREWVRLPVNLHLLYALHDSDIYRKSRMINLGGGGLLFATNQKLKLKENLKIIIELDTGEKLNLAAMVVRFTENTGGPDNYNFLVGVKFINIRKGEQDRLVRMILKNQREFLQEEKYKEQGEISENVKPPPENDKLSI